MKQVIEMLAQAYGIIRENLIGDEDDINMVCNLIAGAVADLKAPRWETPEQREKRTGEPWPDDWAVYALYETAAGEERFWAAEEYCYSRNGKSKCIVCATEAGPPPDDWDPEA
jgi:hypothetical protein